MTVKDQLVSVFEDIHQTHPWAITERQYEAKEDILVEDDDGDDDVYLIRSGKATVILGGGQSEIVLGEGDLIGEMSFLLGNKRTASIIAKESVICWAVTVSNMEKVFETDLPLAVRFYKALGALLALRVVDTSKLHAQHLVFQSHEDALIALMRTKTMELRDHLNNLFKVVSARLSQDIERYKEAVASVDKDDTLSTVEKRERVVTLREELIGCQQDEKTLQVPKIRNIVQSVIDMLMEIQDIEKRHEVGRNANLIFAESILSAVELMQHQDALTVEPIDTVLYVLGRQISSGIWDAKTVFVSWLEEILLDLPTMQAFRQRHELLSSVLLQRLNQEECVVSSVMVVQDVVGVIITKVFSQLARLKSNLLIVATESQSLYQVEYSMTQRMGRINAEFCRIPSMLSLVLEGEQFLPETVLKHSQDAIVVNGWLNYLPDRYLVQLLNCMAPFLSENGVILISGILPTNDQALFNDFLYWPMIRRTQEEVVQIFLSAGFDPHIHIRQNAMVVQATPRIA